MTYHYRLTVKEDLDENWSAWFDHLTVTPAPGGGTLVAGLVRDQAALHGLLGKIRDLGLTLLAVAAVPPEMP